MPSPTNFSEPRHRFYDAMKEDFAEGTPRQKALHALIYPDAGLPSCEDMGVAKAYISYMNEPVRALFDACLLAKASSEELELCFGVDKDETAAYAELFFDTSVFGNDFHVVAYISALGTDTPAQAAAKALLQEAFTQGFAAVKFKYGASHKVMVTPELALRQIFTGDAKRYAEMQNLPLTSKAAKDLRSLGKHVVTTAQTLEKLAPKSAVKTDKDFTFVLDSAPPNPTLDDLLSKGVEIIH